MSTDASAYTDFVTSLARAHWDVMQGRLLVDGCECEALAVEFGTPLYVYSQRTLERSWQTLRAAFAPPMDLYYSIKANPSQAILRFFLDRGCGLEVASAGELQQSLAAGCQPERILFAGPGKTDAELQLALDVGLGEIHVESLGEMRRLRVLAERAGTVARIALRVNPRLATATGAMQMGGRPSPFGLDEDDIPRAVGLAMESHHLEIQGLHSNTGTQLLDAHQLLEYYRYAMNLGHQLATQLGHPLRTLDLGGGLGIPYFSGQTPLDMDEVAGGMQTLLAECHRLPTLGTVRVMIEPGRFMVGPSGLYLARVIDCKRSSDQSFVVLDGGLHHHLAATGNFGQPLRRPFPMAKVGEVEAERTEPVTLVGPLCTPLDTFGKQLPLPQLKPGDLIAILQSGAYARSASPLSFLSHPSPAEVLVADGQPRLIRRRGVWQDMMRDQMW
jgi:diaminopimelate decarboxylase